MASPPRHLEWLDPIKAFALLGVLMNHLVEEFGRGPWFTNPSRNWAPLAERLTTFFPAGDPLWIAVPRFLGWLGDATPGVFILASGLALGWSVAQQPRDGRQWVPSFFARRLAKLYPPYWAAHLALAALSVALPVALINLGGPRSMLSFAGVRVGELFFHINPSWWFFWTILQLYLMFPLLVWLHERMGGMRFLASALLVTIAARAFGILYVDGLYYWMTGAFALTRLGEFAIGMWAAEVLRRRHGELPPTLQTASGCLAVGLPVYASGLACSILLITTVVSNVLVTVGLTLLFLGLWHAVRGSAGWLGTRLSWLGGHSYGIFLLHQVPLKWAVELGSASGLALPAAIGALAASVPAGVWIETRAAAFYRWLTEQPRRRLESTLAVALLVLLAVLEPFLPDGMSRARVCFQLMAITAFLTLFASMASRQGRRLQFGGEWVSYWAALATVASVWVAPGHGDLIVAITFPIALSIRSAGRRQPFRFAVVLAALVAVVAVLAGAELALRRWAPLETNVWGELPALTRHPTRVYGLKPSSVTRLRYNNYDYVVETNAQGLNGPEIAAERDPGTKLRVLILGNAFTMPEGLHWRKAYPALLETTLNECLGPGTAQVINGGVTGYSPTEKIAAARELVRQYQPDVVVDQFFLTELDWMTQDPESRLQGIGLAGGYRQWLRGMWGSMQAPLHWRQRRAGLNEAITGRPSPWRFDKSLLRYFAVPPGDAYSTDRRAALETYYRTLARLAESSGAKLVSLYVPAAVEVQPPATLDYFPWTEALDDARRYDLEQGWRFFLEATAAASVRAYSLKPALRSSAELPYFAASWHWSEPGHRVAARTLAESLAQDGVIPRSCTKVAERP